MLGDLLISTGGAARKQFSNPFGERLDVLLVQFVATLSFSLSSARPDFAVSQTFGFGLLQSRLFNE